LTRQGFLSIFRQLKALWDGCSLLRTIHFACFYRRSTFSLLPPKRGLANKSLGYACILVLALSAQCLAFEPVPSQVDFSRVLPRPGSAQTVTIKPPQAPAVVPARQRAVAPTDQRIPTASAVLRAPEKAQSVTVKNQAHLGIARQREIPISAIVPPLEKAEYISASAPPKPKSMESPVLAAQPAPILAPKPPVRAKAMFCLDCSSNKVVLAKNTSEPLPIASITKLLTAMIVIDEMNLESVLEVPDDIKQVERHVVGLKAGDLLTVRDLLHGMLIESGNDCAEVLARGYPKGGRTGFIAAMNKRAGRLGAAQTTIYTPSGLDMKFLLGRKEGRSLASRKPNTATAQEVAVIAMEAFKYPLIREISSMKTYSMRTHNQPARTYPLASNDRLLHRNLPIAGAKTGYTGMAGKCIVALFKDQKSDYIVVVLNTPQHFKAAEKIYRWACKAL